MGVRQPINENPQIAENTNVDQMDHDTEQDSEHQVEQHSHNKNVDRALRRSTRERKSAIFSDYVVYLQESDNYIEAEIGVNNDPESFAQAMDFKESELWYNAMKDEMNSMKSNKVWNLIELPKGVKPIGCKWVFKTKRDSSGNIERHKARLVAKGFTQKEGIDYSKNSVSFLRKIPYKFC